MYEMTNNGSVFILNDGSEFTTHEKPYTNVIDDLLSLVQCVVAGIASISSKVVNNCLEFKICVSTKQPIIILRYELFLNHQCKNSSPILFNLLKLDNGAAKSTETKTAKSIRNVQKDYLSVNTKVALQNVHGARETKGFPVKCDGPLFKQHQHSRISRGKCLEVKKNLDHNIRNEVAPKKIKINEDIEIIEIDSDVALSQIRERINCANNSVQPMKNPGMPQICMKTYNTHEAFNASVNNYYVGKNTRKVNLRDDYRKQFNHPFISNHHRDHLDLESTYIFGENVNQNDIYYLEGDCIKLQEYYEPSLSQRDEKRRELAVEDGCKENLFLQDTCLDEEEYQEVNALPVICILEDEHNDGSEKFKNGIRTLENELNLDSDILLDDSELLGDNHFQNKYCVQVLKRFRHKRRYEKIKTAKKLHMCSYCKKTFPTMFGKVQHENIHTEARPYSCRYCSKTFNTFSNKYGHERIHMGIKPYVCSYCGKSFGRNGDKVRHERIHTGEKPYSCSVCGRAFNQLSSKNQHEKLHTGEKPHTCRFCGKSFACVSSKNRHEKIHY